MTAKPAPEALSEADAVFNDVVRDGYFHIPSFFERDRVMEVRTELEALLERDLLRRREEKTPTNRLDEGRYRTAYTPIMHTRFFPTFESPLFASLVADMLKDTRLSAFIAKGIGSDFRLRTDLVRRSTGKDDSIGDPAQIPHEWHRDGAGEFTFGIFLDDVTELESGGTAVVPGSHRDRVDPRWDLLLNAKARPSYDAFLAGMHRIDPAIFEQAETAKDARAMIEQRRHEILGKMGDIYMFFNQTWHGRAANKTGKPFMIARVGGYAAGYPSPEIDMPGTQPLDPLLREHYDGTIPTAAGEPYIVSMMHNRVSDAVFETAAREKHRLLADSMSA